MYLVTSRGSKESVLDPVLFNVYINDNFFALKGFDTCNFADDATPYVRDSNLKSVLETLEHNFELAIAWFEMNYRKLNIDKGHLFISGNKSTNVGKNGYRFSLEK